MFSKTLFTSLPLFFLDVLFDMMNKGQNPSTHHPGMEGEKCEFGTKRETEMSRQDDEDRKVEKVWQAQERHRGVVENEGEYEANKDSQKEKTSCPELSCHATFLLPHPNILSLMDDDNPHPVSTISHLNHMRT